jgi:hypothetical protein
MVEYDIAEEEYDLIQAQGFEKIIDKVWDI